MTTKLLRHPHPFEYQSLNSYFIRLSVENYCSTNDLQNLFGLNYYNLGKLNVLNNKDVITRISHATNLDKRSIEQMTFNALVSDKPSQAKFCPHCLAENLYERLYWSIDEIKVCTKHKTFLVTTCNLCGRKLSSSDVARGRCICGEDLLALESEICHLLKLNHIQKKLIDSFILGYNTTDYSEFLDLRGLIKFFETWISEISNSFDASTLSSAFYPIWDSPDLVSLLIEDVLEQNAIFFSSMLTTINNLVNDNFSYNPNDDKLPKYLTPLDIINPLTSLPKNLEPVLYSYLSKHYSLDFFINRLKPILVEEKFVPIEIGSKLLGLDFETVIRNFIVIRLGHIEYIELENLLELTIPIIRCSIQTNEYDSSRISIPSLYKMFENFDINLKDITGLISGNFLSAEQLSHGGLDGIFIPSLKAKELLLKMALDRITQTASM